MPLVLRDVQLEATGEALDAEDVAGGGIREELQHTRLQVLRRRFIMHIEKRLVRILLGDGLLQEADVPVAGGFEHLEIAILELIPWLREDIGGICEATRALHLFHHLIQDRERLCDGIVLRIFRQLT